MDNIKIYFEGKKKQLEEIRNYLMGGKSMDIDYFVHALMCLRIVHPFSVTSWIRTKDRNLTIGGHPNSFHLRGLAVDVVLDDGSEKKDFQKSASHYGLEVIDEGDHLHVEPK